MARQARVTEGVPRHINRPGNNREDVFLLDVERRFYFYGLRVRAVVIARLQVQGL